MEHAPRFGLDSRKIHYVSQGAASPLEATILPDEIEPWPPVSHACTHPVEPQSRLVLTAGYPRHPHDGNRPKESGYCPNPRCKCSCHKEAA
jgi:hypothetical protein